MVVALPCARTELCSSTGMAVIIVDKLDSLILSRIANTCDNARGLTMQYPIGIYTLEASAGNAKADYANIHSVSCETLYNFLLTELEARRCIKN
jgi:hypothetical protein